MPVIFSISFFAFEMHLTTCIDDNQGLVYHEPVLQCPLAVDMLGKYIFSPWQSLKSFYNEDKLKHIWAMTSVYFCVKNHTFCDNSCASYHFN